MNVEYVREECDRVGRRRGNNIPGEYTPFPPFDCEEAIMFSFFLLSLSFNLYSLFFCDSSFTVFFLNIIASRLFATRNPNPIIAG